MANSDLGALLLWLTWVLQMDPQRAVTTATCILLACGAEPTTEAPELTTSADSPAAPAA